MIFLTGATGFIGDAIARRLAARGERLRCLVLPEEPLNGLASLAGVEIVRGDVNDADSLRNAGADVDTVIHCAALMLPNRDEDIRRVNTEGTRNVVAFAQAVGARRLVYFSAVSAVYQQKNVYGESKAAAEALVAAAGLEHTILRPTMVYGRNGGLHFQQLVRLIRRAPGVLPVLGSGRARLQPIWIDDLVRALELVLDHPQTARQTYGVSGATVLTFNDLVDRISVALGRRPPRKLHVPLAVCQLAARAAEPLLGPTFFSPGALRGINEDAALDHSPLQAACGFDPVPLEVGLRQALTEA